MFSILIYISLESIERVHTTIYEQILASSPHSCVGFLWVLWFTPTMHVQLTVDSKLPLAESNGMSVFEAGLELTTPKTQLLAANKKKMKKDECEKSRF